MTALISDVHLYMILNISVDFGHSDFLGDARIVKAEETLNFSHHRYFSPWVVCFSKQCSFVLRVSAVRTQLRHSGGLGRVREHAIRIGGAPWAS